jgi:membrane-bound lytic murein transglycosylase D
MRRSTRSPVISLVALLGVAVAGCSTTRGSGEYSSLPPSPQHPAGKAARVPTTVVLPPLNPDHGDPSVPPDEQADLLNRIRAGYALPQVQHYAVDREVASYCSRPDFLDRTFRRGSRYLYYIVTEIERRGMPLELALLPVVESAFNPVAYSRSRASGLWQFIPSTGKHYGLAQNWWIDERRDVLRATDAALAYLQYLNQYFNGDWYLAIAAYNGGEGNVSRAIQRNAAAGRPTDFFSLDLRAETRDYVPKLLAISRIVADPSAYGLSFAAIPNTPYFGIVDPGRQVHLGEAADLAGISRDDMFALNPAFNRMTTPPNGPHRLLLPVATVEPFRAAIASDEGAKRVAAAAVAPPPEERHRVRRGDTLSAIARHYGVSIADLREANHLRGSVIHPGETLLIPRGPAPTAPPATAAAAGSMVATVAETRPDIGAQLPERQAIPAQSRPGTHTVRSGDTLWGIARRYGITVPVLASTNDLDPNAPLRAGTRLKIPTRGAAASGQEATRMTYQVRRGDTLSQIAARFNVSVQDLMSWNQIRQSRSLKAGQRLVLYVDPARVSGG